VTPIKELSDRFFRDFNAIETGIEAGGLLVSYMIKVRNDALEEAAKIAEMQCGYLVAEAIRALMEKP
jgi:hypothetical protein